MDYLSIWLQSQRSQVQTPGAALIFKFFIHYKKKIERLMKIHAKITIILVETEYHIILLLL